MTDNSKKKTKKASPTKGKKQEISQLEKNALDRWWESKKKRVGPPKFEKVGEKTVTPVEKNPDIFGPQLFEVTGSTDIDFSNLLLSQVASASPIGTPKETANFDAALMHGLRPRDEIEGILIAQMTGTHNLIMEYMKRAVIPGQYLEAANDYTNRSYKLMNIFLKQLEALEKYRGKPAQQKVIVEHVHIHEGGQAVVGHIESRPRGEGDDNKK